VHEDETVPHRVQGLPLRALRVEVIKGPDRGATVTATDDSVTIGTAPGNHMILTDETVSRYHLELQRRGDRIIVEDHASTNGTLLGTAGIERASITAGTQLQLGRTTIKVDDGDTVTLELHATDALGRLRGRTPVMRQLMARIEKAAKTDASVLLIGETGTGKEVIAHAIHEASARAQKPFETVDCGALLPTLIASELFGHERGAFTGADRQHIGAFERADGGTIFLDEIGELPAALQSALLGVLERRRFRRVGGNKELTVDVRVIAATHRDLRIEVNAGTFRQDLYYRLAVLLLRIPPLRERISDIPLLVEHFLREAGFEGPVEDVLPSAAMDALKAHRWPGNVRELRNLVEATLAMGEAPHLEGGESPARASSRLSGAPGTASGFLSVPITELIQRSYKEARDTLLRDFETIYLKNLMERTSENVSLASREAKMNRSYLIEMLKRHGFR
jgi:DNA-binding NtrC family response regulator